MTRRLIKILLIALFTTATVSLAAYSLHLYKKVHDRNQLMIEYGFEDSEYREFLDRYGVTRTNMDKYGFSEEEYVHKHMELLEKNTQDAVRLCKDKYEESLIQKGMKKILFDTIVSDNPDRSYKRIVLKGNIQYLDQYGNEKQEPIKDCEFIYYVTL